jgi:methylmalonyl-CoA mutase N-terminal domain/subunit
LRTQQVIAFESGAPQTVDPLAGSYYIESLTNEIEARAVDYLEKIEAMGGMLKAIERGYVQQEIQNAAYEYQQAVDRLEAVVVGVNRFHVEQENAVPIQRIDPNLEPKQVERLRALRAKRDADTWQAAIRAVEDTARSGEQSDAADTGGGRGKCHGGRNFGCYAACLRGVQGSGGDLSLSFRLDLVIAGCCQSARRGSH